MTSEEVDDGMIVLINDGDIIYSDAEAGVLKVAADLCARPARKHDLSANEIGMGRELFSVFRNGVGTAEAGASIF